jgi:ABC-type lipopolysaccharide export system ATPase subunit
VLDVGKVIFRGAPEDLLDDALVRSAYLGDLFAGDPSETSETSGAGDV